MSRYRILRRLKKSKNENPGKQANTQMSFILGDMPNPVNCTSVFTAMPRTGSGVQEPTQES